MGDNISTWNPVADPYVNYMNQFTAQYGNFRPLQYAPHNTVAPLTPQMNAAANQQYGVGQFMQGQGRGLANYGAWGQQLGRNAPSFVQAQAATGHQAGNIGRGTQNNVTRFAGGANSLDQTGMNTGRFQSIAANDALQGEIDRVAGDIMRNTTENTLPGIATSAVGTGNAYSSRTQHAYDTAMRDTREAIGDASAALRYQNFNAARQATLGQQAQNQQAEQARRQMAMSGYLQGGQMALQGLSMQQQGQQFGASTYNQMGQQGVQNQLAGTNLMQQGVGNQLAAGQFRQDRAQMMRDEATNRFRFNQMAPYQTMQLFSQSLAPPAGMPVSYGGAGGGSTAAGMSTLPGLMMGAASLYGAYQGGGGAA